MNPEVTIVIVTYNSADVLANCLDHLTDFHVIIVDNGSDDDTRIIAEQHDAEFISSGGNVGYGRAANIGFAKVQTPFALLMNPDIEISGATIERLVEEMAYHPETAISAPLLYNHHTKRGKQQTKLSNVHHIDINQPMNHVDWLSGAIMLFCTDNMQKTGGFDENIFMFYEDDDICIRAKNKGCELSVFTDYRAEHYLGTSCPPSESYTMNKTWHMMWAKLYVEQKHHGEKAAKHLAEKELHKIDRHKWLRVLHLYNKNKGLDVVRRQAIEAFLAGEGAFHADGTPNGP